MADFHRPGMRRLQVFFLSTCSSGGASALVPFGQRRGRRYGFLISRRSRLGARIRSSSKPAVRFAIGGSIRLRPTHRAYRRHSGPSEFLFRSSRFQKNEVSNPSSSSHFTIPRSELGSFKFGRTTLGPPSGRGTRAARISVPRSCCSARQFSFGNVELSLFECYYAFGCCSPTWRALRRLSITSALMVLHCLRSCRGSRRVTSTFRSALYSNRRLRP